MRILFSATAIGIDLSTLPNEVSEDVLKEIFDTISDEFEEMADDISVYLYEDWDSSRFLFGKNDPRKLLESVHCWNSDIEKEFLEAADTLLQVSKTGKLPEYVDADNTVTYRLRKAACELDNHWTSFGEHAVFKENESGYAYFRVRIEDTTLADIEAHPENYGIVEVFPK